MKKIELKHGDVHKIAQAAGYSHGHVSRVLNGHIKNEQITQIAQNISTCRKQETEKIADKIARSIVNK